MSESPPFQSPFHSPLSELIILLVQFTAGRSGDDVRLQGRDRERGGGDYALRKCYLPARCTLYLQHVLRSESLHQGASGKRSHSIRQSDEQTISQREGEVGLP